MGAAERAKRVQEEKRPKRGLEGGRAQRWVAGVCWGSRTGLRVKEGAEGSELELDSPSAKAAQRAGAKRRKGAAGTRGVRGRTGFMGGSLDGVDVHAGTQRSKRVGRQEDSEGDETGAGGSGRMGELGQAEGRREPPAGGALGGQAVWEPGQVGESSAVGGRALLGVGVGRARLFWSGRRAKKGCRERRSRRRRGGRVGVIGSSCRVGAAWVLVRFFIARVEW
jgi:hypothetical protein